MIGYLFFLILSVFFAKKYGSERNIGLLWSLIFSIFCPFISIIIIFLSKKKNELTEVPNISKWGVTGLIILILTFIGDYPRNLYEALGAITLPISIFIYKFSSEAIGAMIATNLYTVFPIYGLTRKYIS